MKKAKDESICRFCGEHKKLAKAHILSEWCFKTLTKSFDQHQSSDHLLILTNRDIPKQVVRSPGGIGVYDQTILCAECDGFSSDWESGAKKIFLEDFPKMEVVKHEGKEFGRYSEEINQELLKLFALTVLWKASISSQDFYHRISLGQKYESIALDMIRSKNPGRSNDFPVILSYYQDVADRKYAKSIKDPIRTEIAGLNFYKFYFLGFEMNIKVDNRPLRYPLTEFALGANPRTIFIAKDFVDSKEHMQMLNLLKGLK